MGRWYFCSCNGLQVQYLQYTILISKQEYLTDPSMSCRFGAGQGLSLDNDRCITGKAYTIYLEASLDTTSGWRRIIGADGWGDSG